MTDTLTPNARLSLITPTRSNWSDAANNNTVLLDAIIGSYFTINNLKGIWTNSTVYAVDDAVVDSVSGVVYKCLVANTSPATPTTFTQDRTDNPSYWGGYTSPARSRGPWIPSGTSYTVNDFVVAGAQYAICVQNNVSGATFAADTALGYWSILVDLSAVGTGVLPIPGGLPDANKFAVVAPTGIGYTIISVAQAQQNLGGTTTGLLLFTAASAGAALAAIGAQPAGSYQPYSSNLATLSSGVLGAFGISLLACTLQADARTTLGLGTAAYLSTGTGANNVVQLDGAAKLPAVDGSLLINLPAGTASFTTGDGKITLKTTPDSGWVMLNDGTIGSATSGASNRANADCQTLFLLLWNNIADADCPVVSGRGATAAADWAANKKITLLKSLGRTLGIAGTGSGLTARVLGSTIGEEAHTLIAAEQASMPVTGNATGLFDEGTAGGASFATRSIGDGSAHNLTLSGTATGGGGAHNNMQPTTFWNVMLKL